MAETDYLPDALLQSATDLGAASDSDFVANIAIGGQVGLGPSLPDIDASTPLVMNRCIPVIMAMPTFFNDMQDIPAFLKGLVERHCKDLQGIDFNYSLETGSTPVGHDGQELHVPTIAKRGSVSPQMTFNEITGNSVWNFFKLWMHMIKHPDTQGSAASTMNADTAMLPMLMSTFSMTILIIQYDNTLRPENVIDGAIITCMFPTDIGNIGWKSTAGHAETVDRTIQFVGLIQHNTSTKIVAQNIAQKLQLHAVDFNYADRKSVV